MTDAELTRLLAERVMGWVIFIGAEPAGWIAWHTAVERGRGAEVAYLDEKGLVCRCEGLYTRIQEWRPLDSMDDAWMLVERLQEQDWDYEVGSCLSADGEGHVALFSRGTYDPYSDARDEAWDAFAPTPQRAIALAALRAVGVEVE